MKKVKVKFDAWVKLIRKLKECMRANKALNKQIRAYNSMQSTKDI